MVQGALLVGQFGEFLLDDLQLFGKDQPRDADRGVVVDVVDLRDIQSAQLLFRVLDEDS